MKNKAMFEGMLAVKRELRKQKTVTIVIPKRFGFRNHDVFDLDSVFINFDCALEGVPVKIDLSKCISSAYQALSLIVIYAWYLKHRGCTVSFVIDHESEPYRVCRRPLFLR